MSVVTSGDDSKRVRLFRTAVRVAAHFYDAVARNPGAQTSRSPSHLEELNKRWLLLRGDQTVVGYEQSLQKELLPLQGEPVFDHIRGELSKPFLCDQRLGHVNQSALDEVRRCVHDWGGPRAQKHVQQLKLMPLHLESTDHEHTQFFYERSQKRILVRAGSPEVLLRECMILEFSLFHEYLSHAFPAWSKDVEPISEGWLLALEFEWFESQFTFEDNDLLLKVWHHRLEKEHRSFWAGRWLLGRCGSRECVRKFLLEWIGGWDAVDVNDNLDLLSQLRGVYSKAGHRLGGRISSKQKKTLEILDEVLCGPCSTGSWNIKDMRNRLAAALRAYGPGQ
jgi:hypothetical protein